MAFVALGAGTKDWYAITVAPNGDVYATNIGISATQGIWKQTGGSGAFVKVDGTQPWRGICAASNGDIYVAVNNGGIYRQPSGSSVFSLEAATTDWWTGMAADLVDGDIYVADGNTTFGASIRKQTGGSGAFNLETVGTTLAYAGMCVAPNGDVYVVAYNGSIYIDVGGTGAWSTLGEPVRLYTGICAAPNGDIYASVYNGGIYKRTNGAGSFVLYDATARTHQLMATNASGDIFVVTNGASGDIYREAAPPTPGNPGTMTMPSFEPLNETGLPGSYGVPGTVGLPPASLLSYHGVNGYVGTPALPELAIQFIREPGYPAALSLPMATMYGIGDLGSFGLPGALDLPPATLYIERAEAVIFGTPGTTNMPVMAFVYTGTPGTIDMPVMTFNLAIDRRGSYGVLDYPELPIARMAGYGTAPGGIGAPGTSELPVTRLYVTNLSIGYGPGTLGLYELPIQTLLAVGTPIYGTPAVLLPAMALSILFDNLDLAVTSAYMLYALNTMNGSVTKLPYEANSFCELNGTLYAAGPAGIMIFEGADKNNGANIDSRIAKGGMEFGTSKTKRITDFYMLCRTAGSVKVTSSSELDSGAVTTEDAFDIFHGFKSDLPRGVRGRQLGIVVENVAGCDFELAELEFEVDISENRRGRQIRN